MYRCFPACSSAAASASAASAAPPPPPSSAPPPPPSLLIVAMARATRAASIRPLAAPMASRDALIARPSCRAAESSSLSCSWAAWWLGLGLGLGLGLALGLGLGSGPYP